MLTINIRYDTIDKCGIQHSVDFKAEGKDREEVVNKIADFNRQLDAMGWTVIWMMRDGYLSNQ